MAPVLIDGDKRILTLSCCFSQVAFDSLQPHLQGHFTGGYHFVDESVSFATAITVWAMFYRRKTVERPLRAVVKPINDFFGKDTIVYHDF